MSKEIALDLRRYDTPEKLGSLVSDTASLAIEASATGIPRANPHYFVKASEEKVTVPGKDKRDVSEMFAKEDCATKVGMEIRTKLLSDIGNFAYVWISPPDPWPETRIEIGVKKKTKSGRFEYLKAYGISTTLPKDDCLMLGQLLVSMSPENCPYPVSSDDLRSLLIKLTIPEGKDPFEFFSELIELPEKNIFPSILNGMADKNKALAIKAAVVATKPVMTNPGVIYSNPLIFGAYVENRMKYEGYGMNPDKFGCGSSNNEMIASSINSQTLTETTPYYPSEGWHDGKCRVCKASTWVGPCDICKPCEAKF